jgi:hypothetical protein
MRQNDYSEDYFIYSITWTAPGYQRSTDVK